MELLKNFLIIIIFDYQMNISINKLFIQISFIDDQYEYNMNTIFVHSESYIEMKFNNIFHLTIYMVTLFNVSTAYSID